MQTPTPEPSRLVEFTNFMRAHQDMVFSTAARLTGNDAQAEDISQETFTKAYEHFEQLRANPAAGGWLKKVTTNLTLNHLLRYRRRWRLFSELARTTEEDDLSSELCEPAELAALAEPAAIGADLDAEERRAIIDEALRRLPDHQRVPLVLYHFEDLSYEEIAAQLAVSLSKIKTDIRRARAAIKPLLERGGINAAALRGAS